MRKEKLKTKDYITAGAFCALYVVILVILGSVFSFIPIVFLMAPLYIGIIEGPIYMLYVTKVRKKGAIFILSILCGFILSQMSWLPVLWAIIFGLIAEGIIYLGKYKSQSKYLLSYCIYNCISMGPFLALFVAKEKTLSLYTPYYDAKYIETMSQLIQPWMFFVIIGVALIGGFLGGRLSKRVLRKHFVESKITV